MSARRVVYVTYDGLTDPLGASQVLPYVRGLAARGWQFDLVSFEKPGVALPFREPIAQGVAWTALRYHKTPTVPATAFDLAQAAGFIALRDLFGSADLLHARALVPATMALSHAIRRRVPLLFDTRAFWPEEKIDQGHWRADGPVFRAAKALERRVLRRAKAITTLTHDARSFLRHEYAHREEITAPIQVIPTCADLDTFTPRASSSQAPAAGSSGRDAELADRLVLVYVGSLGHWYLEDEMAQFYAAFRRAAGRKTAFLVVTRQDTASLRAKLQALGCGDELVVRSASREEVPGWLRQADASVCFIRPQFSKRASAPTKLGEVLGCGLPVVVNVIGDLARVVGGSTAAFVVDDPGSRAALDRAAESLVRATERPETSSEARRLAVRWYSLADAVEAYDRVYRGMLGLPGGATTDGDWPPRPAVEENG
jgi:glycosyltransferase involved in cell wall biosynthesis